MEAGALSRIGVLSYTAVIVAILAVVVFFIYGGDTMLGFDSSFKTDLVVLLPGLAIFAIGCITIASVRGGMMIAGFGLVGLSFAYLVGQMNTLGLWIPEMLTASFTIANMQLTLIVVCFLVGSVFAAATRN